MRASFLHPKWLLQQLGTLLAWVLWALLWVGRALRSFLVEGGWLRRCLKGVLVFLVLQGIPVTRFIWARTILTYDLEALAEWSLERSEAELRVEAQRLAFRRGFPELRDPGTLRVETGSAQGVDLCTLRVQATHRLRLVLLPSVSIPLRLSVQRAARLRPQSPSADPLKALQVVIE